MEAPAVLAGDRRNRVGVPAVLLTVAAGGWWWSVRMVDEMAGTEGAANAMGGMKAMSGHTLSFAAFVVAWLAMMAAMMLPAVSPVVRLYSLAAAKGRVAPLPFFVAGYLVVWTLVGLPAYFGWRALMEPVADGRPWAARLAGGFLLLAAVWQLTPLKSICLRHCRSPMSVFLRTRGSLARPSAALRAGSTHGVYCIGCCWALMAILVARARSLAASSAICAEQPGLPGSPPGIDRPSEALGHPGDHR